jgi:hypothetical protein
MTRASVVVAFTATIALLTSGAVMSKGRDDTRASTLRTGSQPISIITARLDRDRHLDLAVANLASDTISVFFGRGSGRFHKPAVVSTGRGPRSIQAADVNEDGAIDLLVADSASKTVSLLLGTGRGSFRPRIAVPVSGDAFGGSPLAILAADVNSDEHVDLAVAYVGSNSIAVLLGTGTGSFSSAAFVAFVRDDPQALVAGDFNLDGDVDLATANFDSVAVSTLVGNGDGTFLGGPEYNTGSFSFSLAAADMNRDGFLDLVVANIMRPEPFPFGRDSVSVLLGDGTGQFRLLPEADVRPHPVAIAAADFNNDRKVDVAVANFDSNLVSILYGTGDGLLIEGVELPSGAGPAALAVGDFDRDRRRDLAVANQLADNAQVFLLGKHGRSPIRSEPDR